MYEFDKLNKLHKVPVDECYGHDALQQVDQLTRELWCIRASRDLRRIPGVRTTFYHMLNVIRMLWSNEDVQIYGYIKPEVSTTGKTEVILNTFFLNTIEELCYSKSCCLTGPASCSKSFGGAVYNLCTYYSSPKETMCMISTTTGTASEARIWGEIKSLHRKTQFSKWGINRERMGVIVPYLKCITFDPGALDADNRDASNRDLRDGVQVIPIAKDSKGDTALSTIVGRKNEYVIWTIDELPEMMNGVLKPRANLQAGNPFVQIIGIGNANRLSDPHGIACEPKMGWSTVDSNGTKRWRAKTMNVLYLDGDESPNDHPLIDQDKIIDVKDYPFPKLSNRLGRGETAMTEGNGDPVRGRLTIGYRRFAKGFWYGNSAENTVLSDEYVESNYGDRPALAYTFKGYTCYASFDPGWTSGGDDSACMFAKAGLDSRGTPQVEFEDEAIVISPLVDQKDEYRKLVAREFVRLCKEKDVLPQNACIDINGDGGLMYKAIIEEWKMAGLVGLSSLEQSTNPKYYDRVTEYWFAMRELIATGYVRGWNLTSGYHEDAKSRFYTSVGKGQSRIEKKKDMKNRIHRSPDKGDAAAYLCRLIMSKFGAVRRKVIEQKEGPVIRKIGQFDLMTGEFGNETRQEFVRDSSY